MIWRNIYKIPNWKVSNGFYLVLLRNNLYYFYFCDYVVGSVNLTSSNSHVEKWRISTILLQKGTSITLSKTPISRKSIVLNKVVWISRLCQKQKSTQENWGDLGNSHALFCGLHVPNHYKNHYLDKRNYVSAITRPIFKSETVLCNQRGNLEFCRKTKLYSHSDFMSEPLQNTTRCAIQNSPKK